MPAGPEKDAAAAARSLPPSVAKEGAARRMTARHGGFTLACLGALAVVLVAYANHFANGFHFDDLHVIVNNPSIRGLDNVTSFFTDARTFSALPENSLYRPLLTLSYALDYQRAGGLDPRQFHLTQFLALILLGILLTRLFKRLYDLGEKAAVNRYLALFGATLFCVHTANTQTVNYFSARSNLLATLAIVLSLLVYIEWPRGRRTLLYLVPVVLGGLAKPLTVAFAPLLLVYDFVFSEAGTLDQLRSAGGWRKLLRSAGRAVPALVGGALVYLLATTLQAGAVVYSATPWWWYLATQPFVWLHYARLFLLPMGLTADADWSPITSAYDTRLFAGLLFLGLLLYAIHRSAKVARARPLAFGLAWFCVALLPSSSVFPLAEVYNEHRIFFPFVGLALAATWAAYLAAGSRPASRRGRTWAGVCVAGLAVLALHAVGTHTRNKVWRTEETLWSDVTRKSPGNGRAWMNYGLTLMNKGRYEEALRNFEWAQRLTPNYANLEVNLGIVKSALGRPQIAESHFRRALELRPDYAGGHVFYAQWLMDRERGPEAVEHLRSALASDPRQYSALKLLARTYAALGDQERLSEMTRTILELHPRDEVAGALHEGRVPFAVPRDVLESYLELGRNQIDLGRWIDAAIVYRHVLTLQPDSPVAWNNLGWARLKLGFLSAAEPCFEKASDLDPAMEIARNNLGWLKRELERRAAQTPTP